MLLEEKKAIARRYLDLFNQGNLEGLSEVVLPTVVDHYSASGVATGLEGLKQTLSQFRRSFPDMYVTIEDIVAEGDIVVVRCTGRGTHRGDFAGIRPTGKRVTVPIIAIYRIANGKITDRWNIADSLAMIQQLGTVAEAA
ncbi:MAG: ester cyclase [Chloroflexi bacterium]|nr:ester cyclase [Chloroflexota bacterium]